MCHDKKGDTYFLYAATNLSLWPDKVSGGRPDIETS